MIIPGRLDSSFERTCAVDSICAHSIFNNRNAEGGFQAVGDHVLVVAWRDNVAVSCLRWIAVCNG